jgi:Xaa-Pro aminopeptidase
VVDGMLCNLDRAFEIMDQDGLDMIVASSPKNFMYLSDIQSASQHYRGAWVYGFVLLPRDGEPTLIMPLADAFVLAENCTWIKDLRFYEPFYVKTSDSGDLLTEAEVRFENIHRRVDIANMQSNGLEVAIQTLREKGSDLGTIGIDESSLSPSVWNRICTEMKGTTIVEAASTLRKIRMVKTHEEVKRLRKAIAIIEKAIGTVHEMAKPGSTEIELAEECRRVMLEEGGNNPFLVFECGRRSVYADAGPTEYILKKGDIIRIDGGCLYEGYNSDIADLAILGKASDKQKKYWKAIISGHEQGINSVHPGVKASDLFRTVVSTVQKNGIPHFNRHHCGHGIGLATYDMPIVSPNDDTILEEGTVLNIETPYYEIGFGGMQDEDTILVTKDGCEILSNFKRDLTIL